MRAIVRIHLFSFMGKSKIHSIVLSTKRPRSLFQNLFHSHSNVRRKMWANGNQTSEKIVMIAPCTFILDNCAFRAAKLFPRGKIFLELREVSLEAELSTLSSNRQLFMNFAILVCMQCVLYVLLQLITFDTPRRLTISAYQKTFGNYGTTTYLGKKPSTFLCSISHTWLQIAFSTFAQFFDAFNFHSSSSECDRQKFISLHRWG